MASDDDEDLIDLTLLDEENEDDGELIDLTLLEPDTLHGIDSDNNESEDEVDSETEQD